ncbi:chorismate pyruvate lyase (modular protein) [Escherichia fergusonii ATCC 35469]|uniref:Chorismate pyruvate-lyase n=2 Tax=Escherichia fergusonii TaxID=564 RepID=B7LL11_ESCF3|nr:chorismate pyruvate lyase (modular protein) [Escherichia fergusonii ATCC 35469]
MLILQQLVRLLAHLFLSFFAIVAFLLRNRSLNFVSFSRNLFSAIQCLHVIERRVRMSHPALTQLRALRYFAEIPALDPAQLDWLLLEDSMTKRFEQQGKKVSVTVIREGFVGQQDVALELSQLPQEPRYWLREILLCADGEPWLAGRTVVPESTLSGPELALQKLGKTPLGRYLFTSSTLSRDFIEIGRDAELWGRRSRLRLSGKPLMLTELFLPASPLY